MEDRGSINYFSGERGSYGAVTALSSKKAAPSGMGSVGILLTVLSVSTGPALLAEGSELRSGEAGGILQARNGSGSGARTARNSVTSRPFSEARPYSRWRTLVAAMIGKL